MLTDQRNGAWLTFFVIVMGVFMLPITVNFKPKDLFSSLNGNNLVVLLVLSLSVGALQSNDCRILYEM